MTNISTRYGSLVFAHAVAINHIFYFLMYFLPYEITHQLLFLASILFVAGDDVTDPLDVVSR